MIDERLKEKLLSMTWEGLREWSDPKSVERGKGYLNEVETPAAFVDGSVVSEVHGSDDYYTKLAVDGKGELQGVCTCPVGRRCKHTVALALVAAKLLKGGGKIAEANMKSVRWRTAEEELSYAPCNDACDVDEGIASREDADLKKQTADPVANYVFGRDDAGLRALVSELLEKVPEVRAFVQLKLDIEAELRKMKKAEKPKIKDIVHEARQAISVATADRYDPWDRDGYDEVPDYSSVLEYFKILDELGAWKELMELGEKLKKRGNRQASESRDEGEISSQVSECMDVVVRSVMSKGDMDALEKVKWEERLLEKDDYCILHDMKASWRTSLKASKADWERVCAYQMAKYEKTDKKHRYYLEKALNDVVAGLEHTGQFDRAVTMMTDALDVCPQLYPRLAEMLLRHDRREEAATICRKGIAKGDHMIPTYELRDLLRKMASETKDPKVIAAQAFDEFLASRHPIAYDKLHDLCVAMGVWKRVHDFILRHYETGAKIEEEKNWPLAQMEMTAKEEFAFPRVDILTDLALYEKRKDDVVKWYRKLTRNGLEFSESYGWGDDRNEDVVAAIGDDEPELALKFWQWRVATNRGRTDRHCYRKIGVALRKMRPLMERLGCSDEWLRLLNDLRTEGKMRRNLVAILNEIDREQGGSGRIADTK